MNDEINKICREKYWSELTTEERVERMREQVKNLQREIRSLGNLIQNLSEHNHLNNEIVMPLRSRRGLEKTEQTRRGPGKDDVYF
jgi:conjugal transfer/entry exclusion protein